jgi:arylsulfatase A-like enzyme
VRLTRREFGLLAGAAGCSRRAKPRPNVVIFYCDDLRATAIDLYNPAAVSTPNLQRLARAGTTFDQSHSPHPLCCPARVSLWTGQYSSTHGSRHNQALMSDRAPSLAAPFREAGYTLGIFGKNHCFTPSQLERWFAADYSIGSAKWKAAISPETSRQLADHARWAEAQGGALMPPAAAPYSHEIFPTHMAAQHAVNFVEKHREGPFLLWVSVTEPHTPTEVPEKFAAALPADKLTLPPFREKELDSKNTRMKIFDYLIRSQEIPEEYLARYLSVYSGKTAFADYELGRVMDAIERRGLREDTIFVFTSDNGDFAGEHHLIVKTGSLVDSMTRMPLVVSWPGSLPSGKREPALVNHIDIMPTLLDLCGLAAPGGVEGRRLPFAANAPRREFVYAEYGNGEPEYTWAEARKLGPAKRLGDYALKTPEELAHLDRRERAGQLRMIRTQTHKLVADSNGEIEFYDLTKDPDELTGVQGQPPYREEEARLTKRLAG